MLNKKLIGTIAVITGLGVLIYLFLTGAINFVDYATQLAVGISLAIFGVLYWTFKDDIDRIIGKTSKQNSGFIELEDGNQLEGNSKDKEERLNDLLKEVDNFILEWKRRLGFKIGYKRQIETKEIYKDIKNFPKHAKMLQHGIRSMDNIPNDNLTLTLQKLTIQVNEIIQLGSDLETAFRFLQLKEAKKIPNEKVTELIKKGDQICTDLREIRTDLQKLRIEII